MCDIFKDLDKLGEFLYVSGELDKEENDENNEE